MWNGKQTILRKCCNCFKEEEECSPDRPEATTNNKIATEEITRFLDLRSDLLCDDGCHCYEAGPVDLFVDKANIAVVTALMWSIINNKLGHTFA